MSHKRYNAGKEKSSKRQDITDDELYNIIYDRLGITKIQLQELAKQKSFYLQNSFPASILRYELSSLEAIVKYLRENRNHSYKEIGLLLSRNPKTLAVTYKIAKSKMPEKYPFDIEYAKDRIAYTAFETRLSILESICVYLKSQNMNYSKIARLIEKDPRTVWTVCKRAENKIKKGEKQDD